ncbi:hypothetical protein DSO57_1026340 [Entomophthora muscae]|uniref:Uncharacterized protein n=1 Tax=Entomophthora muscae TaxID=34485 RepID=A0ACC2S408_9FUNG|nr:hypothetical protein DSO57_1026340 [Entomophthora muscae]
MAAVSIVSTLILECSGLGSSKTLSVASTTSLLRIHGLISDLFDMPLEGGHKFLNQESCVEYCDLRNITNFDGFITGLADGVYLHHPHPHSSEDSTEMVQVRAEHLWAIDLALSDSAPLLYLRNGCCITITLLRTRPSAKASLPAKYSRASLSLDKQSILNATLQMYASNLAQSIYAELILFHSDPYSTCEWLESTGESCCYCTPGFL